MNIRITDLSRKATENELKELFSKYGEVVSVSIVTDKATGKSKGFAFVEMKHKKDGEIAVTKLNKTKFKSERITVKVVE